MTGFHDGKRDFAVNFMYKLLDEEQQIGHRNEWKKIRKIQALEWVWYFVWLLKYDRLLTNWNKRRLGIGSVMCGYCGNIVEEYNACFTGLPFGHVVMVECSWY